jgi:LCP family protein required for cell wall assembly
VLKADIVYGETKRNGTTSIHHMKDQAKVIQTASPETTDFQPISWQKMLLKATALSLLFTFIMLLVTALGLGIFAYNKLSQFFSVSGLSFSESKEMIEQGINQAPTQTNGKTTILILGIDTVENKAGAPPLTDTMLLASINYQNAEVTLLSLPRDLWSEEYRTKINALYFYGQEKYPEKPQQFPTEVVANMTGVPIHHTLVFSLDSIAELVDILGGIDVEVPQSFVDTEFPREDVAIESTTDPTLLYETVEFTAGTEHMTAERVTKYIRSRHSEGTTGTDIDRSTRQQLVITSLISKVTSRDVLTDPILVGNLYKWYQERISSYISTTEAISIGYGLFPQRNNLEFSPVSLPIRPDDPNGVIEHLPPAQTDNQWTYSVTEPTVFKSKVQDILIK